MIRIRNSEWKVLFRQLVNSGKSKWEAGDIIDKHKKIMKDYYEELDSSGKTEADKEIKFKERFWELCQRAEV